MKTLIKKDIYLMGFYNVFIIMTSLIGGFMTMVNKEYYSAQVGSLWLGIILIYLYFNSLTREDYKTKDVILKSLPIDRKNIILSRYISMFIYTAFVFGIIFFSPYIYIFLYDIGFEVSPMPISGLVFNIIFAMGFISIVVPVQYLSRNTSKKLNIILSFILAISPIIIKGIGDFKIIRLFKYIGDISFGIEPIIFILSGMGIYFISFKTSEKLYKSIE